MLIEEWLKLVVIILVVAVVASLSACTTTPLTPEQKAALCQAQLVAIEEGELQLELNECSTVTPGTSAARRCFAARQAVSAARVAMAYHACPSSEPSRRK